MTTNRLPPAPHDVPRGLNRLDRARALRDNQAAWCRYYAARGSYAGSKGLQVLAADMAELRARQQVVNLLTGGRG